MSRGSDEEREREMRGEVAVGMEERGGLKEREGWRLQRSFRLGRCQLQHTLSPFSPKQELESFRQVCS